MKIRIETLPNPIKPTLLDKVYYLKSNPLTSGFGVADKSLKVREFSVDEIRSQDANSMKDLIRSLFAGQVVGIRLPFDLLSKVKNANKQVSQFLNIPFFEEFAGNTFFDLNDKEIALAGAMYHPMGRRSIRFLDIPQYDDRILQKKDKLSTFYESIIGCMKVYKGINDLIVNSLFKENEDAIEDLNRQYLKAVDFMFYPNLREQYINDGGESIRLMLPPHLDVNPFTINSNFKDFQICVEKKWHNLTLSDDCLILIAGRGLEKDFAPYIARKYGLTGLSFNPAYHRVARSTNLEDFPNQDIRVSSALGGMKNFLT